MEASPNVWSTISTRRPGVRRPGSSGPPILVLDPPEAPTPSRSPPPLAIPRFPTLPLASAAALSLPLSILHDSDRPHSTGTRPATAVTKLSSS